jgi:heptose I phosphotransferase
MTINLDFTTSDPAGTGLRPAVDGQMWLDRAFEGDLERAGLLRFDDVMAAPGVCLRVIETRENWYLRLHADDGGARGMYLKKHHVQTWSMRLRARLHSRPATSDGRLEAQRAGELARLGIDVMRLVAYGEKFQGDGRLESFLLTEELAGYSELQTFLRKRFPAPVAGRRTTADRQRDQLVRHVAEMTRRLHTAGFNHRDFYCCHFLVKETAPDIFDVRLIDLQRVQHRRWFRRRWIVKDLAQLCWSAPADRIGCRQKMAFLRHYLGGRLGTSGKRLTRSVLSKQRFLERRLGSGS